MKVYHMSQTLQPQDMLTPGHQHLLGHAMPFLQALEHSQDCFYAMLFQGKYLYSVFLRSSFNMEWVNYAKWATEAVFEYVRRREFAHCISRLQCSYFYPSLDETHRLFLYDWGNDPEEAVQVHVYAFELEDSDPQFFDMCLFDQAYDAIRERQDVDAALENARRYFSGIHTDEPVLEILSDKHAFITEDLSTLARSWLQDC